MARQLHLDLARLDAVAANLDLVVEAAEELDVRRRRAVAHEVAGAVEPCRRRDVERVGDEALGGQVRAAEVAARQDARRRCAARPARRPAPGARGWSST